MKKIIEIKKSTVEKINLDFLKNLSIDKCNVLGFGISEFYLYAYLSTLFNNKIILDIGTRGGNSAIALSYNTNNKVRSYDLVEQGASQIKKENITWLIKNFMEDEEIVWDDVAIVMIDVDPHDAIQEREMVKWLKQKNWKGLLLFDDICPHWVQMHEFWNEITEEKYDVTKIGHIHGTGLVNFGSLYDIKIELE